MRDWTRHSRFTLYTALALLTFYVTAPSYAMSHAEAKCDYSRFASRKTAIKNFKEKHLNGNTFQAPADNDAFSQKVFLELTYPKDPPQTFFFYSEDAVLKLLSEKAFTDKGMAAASILAYKKIFFQELKKDAYLRSRIPHEKDGGVYSDYKSIRLRVVPRTQSPKETEQLKERLTKIHVQAAKKFKTEMEDDPVVRGMFADRPGLLSTPHNWNLAAFGDTPAQASDKAHRMRHSGEQLKGPEGVILPQSFTNADAVKVAVEVKQIELIRKDLAHQLRDKRIISEGVPTTDVLDIFRRATGDTSIHTHREYREYIRARFKTRFNLNISDEMVDKLQSYYHHVNEIAPSIYIREQEPISLAPLHLATHGVVSFDVGGQNSLNMRAAMLALKESHHTTKILDAFPLRQVEMTQAILYAAQFAESNNFQDTKEVLQKGLGIAGLHDRESAFVGDEGSAWSTSGDDATFLPSKNVGIPEISRVMRALRDLRKPPSRFRITLHPQNYVDTGTPIAEEERLGLVSEGEGIEKKLRGILEIRTLAGSGIPFEKLKQTMFAIRMHPDSSGQVKIDVLFVRSKKNQSPGSDLALAREIRDALVEDDLPVGYSLGEIYSADGSDSPL